MDYSPVIEKRLTRLHELEEVIAEPGLFDDPRRAGEVMQEHKRIKRTLDTWEQLRKFSKELEDNRAMALEPDEELAKMADDEIPGLEKRVSKLEFELQYALLPRDPSEERDAIVEIRAGTGGDEASLFAADLLRMYSRYGEIRGWKVEPLETSPSEVGGFKEVTFRVSGEGVFRFLKYESGVHRVQRVPATEAQGRIHTSTATVAVLPEAEEVDVELHPDDLRVERCRSGGPGGQHVNTTDSAVQILHIPSGIIVRCQDGRSQIKNKEKAMTILRSKLLEAKQREEAEKYSAHRRSLIGSAGREEKIRTYNFPQNRLTDHRVGLTVYNLDQVMEGSLEDIVEHLQASVMQERLEIAGLGPS